MWHLWTWSSGGFRSAGLTVGLDVLRGLFQGKRFYSSMILDLHRCEYWQSKGHKHKITYIRNFWRCTMGRIADYIAEH